MLRARRALNCAREGWQNGYCTGLENRRPQGLGGSNPSPSAPHVLTRRLAAIAIALLLAPFGRAVAAPSDTIPVVSWLGVGAAGATGAESQATSGVAVAVGRWGIRYVYGDGGGDPWHEFQEAAATFGFTHQRGRRFAAVRSGISIVRWERYTYSILDDPVLVGKEGALGLPVEAQVTWRVARSFSLGFIAIGNANRLHSMAGLLVAGSFHFR